MAGFWIGRVKLGEVVYSTAEGNHFVIATSESIAEQILMHQHIPHKGLKKVCTLTKANSIMHRQGATVTITHNGTAYEADTIFVLGVPKGIDTTKPCKVTFKE